MTQMIAQRAFSTGELSPALSARADLAKYTTALRTCRNFLVQRHGGVANRPGTRFVSAVKTTVSAQQFLRYVSEIPGESVLIECGDFYFRFFLNGAPITVSGVAAWSAVVTYGQGDLVSRLGVTYYAKQASLNQQPPDATYWYPLTGTIYEVPHPFSAVNRPRWVQSGSVITLTHPDVAPQELRFDGLTSWTVVPIVTKPSIDAPTGLNGTTTTPGTLGQSFKYVVTAADKNTYEESEPSAYWEVIRAIGPRKSEPFSLHFVGFQAAVKAQAGEYYIYLDPFTNGIYGFLATAVWDGTGAFDFHDIGFPPDFSQTPPLVVRRFAASGTYPAMAAYYQQRRFFANSRDEPEGVWGSRLGFPMNFGISSPLQDDDAVTFRLAGKQRNPVQHLIGLGTRALVVLTDVGEWLVQGSEQGPLIPTSIQADEIAYWGAAPVVPVVIGKTIIYVQARGRIVRDLQFDGGAGLNGRDLTLLAGHLFDGYTMRALDYAQTPHSIVWVVRSDGTLLGLTYVPDDDLWGWHRHDSGADAAFLDVCVVPEASEDGVYVLVDRVINGTTVRYIERMASRVILTRADAFFVDCGVSYDGAPTAAVSGLDHLEGEIVAVLGDGVVVFNGDPADPAAATFTVSGGAITLPVARSVIHVGLPIRFAEIETVDVDAAGSAVRDKRKRVQSLTVVVEKSAQAFRAGPDSDHLLPYAPESWQASSGLVDDALEMTMTAGFTDHGRFIIRQTDPLPLTVLGIFPQLQIGG